MEIKPIGINGPRIIPTIEPPVTQRTERSVTHGLELPIVNVPDPTFNYPVIDVPTQEEFDAAVRAEQQKQEEEKQEKTRGLPDATPVLPQVQVPVVDKQENKNTAEDTPANNNLGVPVIEVPIVGQVPIPPKEQVLLAGTTATASVAAALVGKSMVEWMVAKMKPVVQQILVRGKKHLNRDLTPYETQILFAFDKEVKMKKIAKLLKKEQKAEKLRQYKEFYNK